MCHFRSRDKDGGHIIRSVIPENPMLHAKLMALSFIVMGDRSLHCGSIGMLDLLFL